MECVAVSVNLVVLFVGVLKTNPYCLGSTLRPLIVGNSDMEYMWQLAEIAVGKSGQSRNSKYRDPHFCHLRTIPIQRSLYLQNRSGWSCFWVGTYF